MALIGRVFEEYGFVWDPPAEVPDLLDGFPGRYAAPAGAFWVSEEAGRVVGSVGVERLDTGTAELHRLYVDPGLRRRGLGLALVAAVQDWCREAGIPRLTLWSDTRFDRAHALYARRGFVREESASYPAT